MTIPIYIAGVAVLSFFLYKLLYGTDTPHIKGLPEVPGLPLFGSLFELGTNHAKVAQGWAKKYGPVFQVRMGNRVSMSTAAIYLRKKAVTDVDDRESYLPIHSTPSDIYGSPTSPPSSPDRCFTPSTRSSPPHRASPSVHRHGTSRARTAAKPLPLHSTDQPYNPTCPSSISNPPSLSKSFCMTVRAVSWISIHEHTGSDTR